MAFRRVLLAVSACVLHPAAGTHEEEVSVKFQAFAEAFGKEYAAETFTRRLKIFGENLAFIQDFNRRATGTQLEVNQFADLTASEFRQLHLSGLSGSAGSSVDQSLAVNAELPDSIDWRTKGAVTPVKDQKTCGACWAFSTTGAIESAIFLAGGSLVGLSEEELVDCSGGADRGCSGGDPAAAYEWVAQHGLCSEASYPYTAFQDECHNQFFPCTPVAHISAFQGVPKNNELALKAAVARQPISVEIEADSDVFRFYKSGVLSGDGCGESLDHAVLAVGYGTENGQDYWLVKNSWNKSWGEEGYVRIARTNSEDSYGECGIAQNAFFPVIKGELSSLMV